MELHFRTYTLAQLLSYSTIICSCTPAVDIEKEKTAILELHNQQQRTHLQENVELLVGDVPDFIEVNRGAVKKPSRTENLERFQAYFDAVEFIKWEDVSPPVFRFSDDATLATTVVEKLVITHPAGN